MWIFLIYAGLVYRNSMYPIQMYDFYSGKILPGFYDNYFVFMRVYLTRLGNGHKPFPLWRNLAFNLIRDAMCYTYPKVFFEWNSLGVHTIMGYQSYFVKVVVITVFLQYLPMGFHYKTKYLGQYLKAEYFMGFPFGNM